MPKKKRFGYLFTRDFIILLIIALVVIPTVKKFAVRKLDERVLARIYAPRRNEPRPPIIFLPGVLATILEDKDTGDMVYGSVFQGDMPQMALPIDGAKLKDNRDNLVPGRPLQKLTWIPGILEFDLTGKARRMAFKIAGFRVKDDSFALTWDWRRDFIEAAQKLDVLIEEIKASKNDPGLKFNLVCHSTGGLVARYYAKYGGEDVLNGDHIPEPTWAGAKNINKVIMLGTPNAGSLEMFQKMHEGLWIPGVGRASVETIFTLPGLYQVLPLEEEDVFIDEYGVPLGVSLYDPANWEKYGWSVFAKKHQVKMRQDFVREYGEREGERLYKQEVNKQRRFLAMALERARKFHKALWAGDLREEGESVKYVLLGADAEPTPYRAILKRTGRDYKTIFHSWKSDLKEDLYHYGDGSVTRESLQGIHKVGQGSSKMTKLPSTYEIFFFSKHSDMTKNMTYIDNVFHILLDED